ncbi:unnamed protein product (macronuclear) [Paramecium tetraurelia]|uniref:Transmembrane protein n=1 Tax=Paramecium tetraurelia TaxID=5888 RepID=A0BDR6_PARTE|nr:uncharacterized protein GSPATT00027713001 [Paramecium tetraurelia]CAK56683.1 unnamed protein product [Paramecium tetraurelia]|eukprot:XP_001424081.1 hypothetical protein (macronuclear) [Paramecium tetraurelia strain d4-2]
MKFVIKLQHIKHWNTKYTSTARNDIRILHVQQLCTEINRKYNSPMQNNVQQKISPNSTSKIYCDYNFIQLLPFSTFSQFQIQSEIQYIREKRLPQLNRFHLSQIYRTHQTSIYNKGKQKQLSIIQIFPKFKRETVFIMKNLYPLLNLVQEILIVHQLEYLNMPSWVSLSYDNIIIRMNIMVGINFILLLELLWVQISNFNFYYQTTIMMGLTGLCNSKLDNLFVTFIIRFNNKKY